MNVNDIQPEDSPAPGASPQATAQEAGRAPTFLQLDAAEQQRFVALVAEWLNKHRARRDSVWQSLHQARQSSPSAEP